MILRAQFVVPAPHRIVEDGAVRVGDGVVQEIGPRNEFRGQPAVDLGAAMILPGLINAHTHLELTHLANQISPGVGFVRWIERIGARVLADDADPERFAQSAREGAAQSVRNGVTLACDITRRPRVTRPALRNGPLRVVSCGEVIAIGKIRHLADERIAAAIDDSANSEWLCPGISPHAPYTVEPNILKTCGKAARESGLPMCIHAAECADETEFTTSHQGPLRAFLEQVGIWDHSIECPHATPILYLAACGLLTCRTLLAHVNYVDPEEIRLIAESGANVVYCPRTHSAFGHDPHPWRSMLHAGVNVCLGTDSLASNPDLSVLNEARFLWQRDRGWDPAMLLRMLTYGPARALGFNATHGLLCPGSAADLTVITLDPSGSPDPWINVLESQRSPAFTMIGGKFAYSESPLR